MNLEIKNEVYKIKVGKEIFSIEYPSFKEAQKVADDFKKVDGDGEKSLELMKKWLVDLGLDAKFFDLKSVKSRHILTVWEAINSVKK